jgi:hypothetical protein
MWTVIVVSSDVLTDDRRGAKFDYNRDYRYRLWREWDINKPTVAFVMLNPSTADESEDDPTLRRCINFAKDWGYGRLEVVNLFALRATDPSELREHPNPVGGANNVHLQQVCEAVDKVVAAWGAHGDLQNRAAEVVEMLDTELFALDTTKDGHPNHPLYQPADIDLEKYTPDFSPELDGNVD